MIVVFFGWILFRAEELSIFTSYVRNMFVQHGGILPLSAYLDKKMLLLILMGVLLCGIGRIFWEKLGRRVPDMIQPAGVVTVPRILLCMLLFWLCVMALENNSYNPFIYFRF